MKLLYFIFVALLIPAFSSCKHKLEEKRKALLVFNGSFGTSILQIEFRSRDSVTFIQPVCNTEIYKTYSISTAQQLILDNYIAKLSRTKLILISGKRAYGCFGPSLGKSAFWGYDVQINIDDHQYDISYGSYNNNNQTLEDFGYWINALDLELNKEHFRTMLNINLSHLNYWTIQ